MTYETWLWTYVAIGTLITTTVLITELYADFANDPDVPGVGMRLLTWATLVVLWPVWLCMFAAVVLIDHVLTFMEKHR